MARALAPALVLSYATTVELRLRGGGLSTFFFCFPSLRWERRAAFRASVDEEPWDPTDTLLSSLLLHYSQGLHSSGKISNVRILNCIVIDNEQQTDILLIKRPSLHYTRKRTPMGALGAHTQTWLS